MYILGSLDPIAISDYTFSNMAQDNLINRKVLQPKG